MIRISTIIISIFTTFALFGQKLDHDNTSKWFAGVNAGAAWNTTDIKNKTKIGWGLMLGRSFNYHTGSPISFDLRLRYLSARYQGQNMDTTNLAPLGATYNGPLLNYKNGPGHTVHNFENKINHLGLEASVHLNNLADRTGWDPYIFGGLNFTWNKAKGDLVNKESIDSLGLYDYSAGKFTQSDFDDQLDGEYETALEGSNRNNIDFMPSLGFGIGYHLSPRLSIGLEHKTTFTLKDRFDGITGGENDLYHYTGAYLKFRFNKRRDRTEPVNDPEPVNPTPVSPVEPTPCENPRIRITEPSHSGKTVTQQLYNFRADVQFVGSQNEITLLVNGTNTNFVYSQQAHRLEAQIQLISGKNEIELRAQNDCGRDAQIVTINYKDCVDPVIQLNNIAGNTIETERNTFQLVGTISNATSVQLNVNGTQNTGFVFDVNTGSFQANVPLFRGVNTIRVIATGSCGTITRNLTINSKECAKPEVSFQGGNGALVSIPVNASASYAVNAFVFNVENKNQVQVQMNGVNIPFSFNPTTGKLIANVTLRTNNNNIRIIANTTCGRDEQFINVNRIVCNSPQVDLVIPRVANSETTKTSTEIKVRLQEISNRNQIRVIVNGVTHNAGNFDVYRKEFTTLVNLRNGVNTIQIIATNDCGTDTENITITSNPCSAIDIQFSAPANNSVTENSTIWVRAYAYNASSINELTLFVNGIQQNLGSFNPTTKLFQKSITLNEGANIIKLAGRNACGNTNESINVFYTPCTPPVLTQLYPGTNPFYTTAESFDIQTTIQNIVGVQNVQMTVNGVLDNSGARYLASTATYYNSTPLQAGNNVIRIIATNDCASQTLEFVIVREIVNDPVEEEMITICHPTAGTNNTPLTMEIPISQWPTYQRQGATLGPCPEPKMTICLNGQTLEILVSEWLIYQRQGATKGDCPEATMIICFVNKTMEIPVSQWSVYQSQGAKKGECPPVDPEIKICYNGRTMMIKTSQWLEYQRLGAIKGDCPEPTMKICYQNRNMEIPVSQWTSFQRRGATKGDCPPVDPEIKICLDGKTMMIKTSEWISYFRKGATKGECPEATMKICYQNRNMEIPVSQWASFQRRGATKGDCPPVDPEIKICLDGKTMMIKTSEWISYFRKGATKGECPEATMKICYQNKNMEIPVSQWASFQRRGATKGDCPPVDPKIKICLDGKTRMIKKSEWPIYLRKGATKGDCPQVVDSEIQICYQGKTMKIPASQWKTFERRGATKGECPPAPEKMKICYQGKTMEIDTELWPQYQRLGAKKGECPEIKRTSINPDNKIKSKEKKP